VERIYRGRHRRRPALPGARHAVSVRNDGSTLAVPASCPNCLSHRANTSQRAPGRTPTRVLRELGLSAQRIPGPQDKVSSGRLLEWPLPAANAG
jgi:hypothetical protein